MSKPLLNVIYKIFPHNISVKQFIERKDIMSTLVEMKGVVKKFPGVTALKDISFDIQAGEVHVLLGENGAGKSTTINILCTVLEKTSGNVKIGGYDLDKEKNKIKELIGIVFQGNNDAFFISFYILDVDRFFE